MSAQVWVGGARLRFIHTPGHSRGGMSIAVGYSGEPGAAAAVGDDQQEGVQLTEANVLTGDTLFPGSCGRIDLPESDKAEMYRSLQNVLRNLPRDMVVWPGHGYSGARSLLRGQTDRLVLFLADTVSPSLCLYGSVYLAGLALLLCSSALRLLFWLVDWQAAAPRSGGRDGTACCA